MRRALYRSLDKPSAFFGIRGRFTTWLGLFLGVALLFGFVVGMMTASIVGIVVFLGAAVTGYMLVLSVQGRMSDRGFAIRSQSRRYARFVRVAPGAFRREWRGGRRDFNPARLWR